MITRVLIFGASLTQGFHDPEGGWADRLKRELLAQNKGTSVFNLGISGDKTKDVLDRFESEIEARTKRWDAFDKTAIIIAVGTNDTYQVGDSNEPVTSKRDFEKQYRELVKLAKKHGKHVLACSVFPVDETRTTPVSWRDITYLNETITNYSRAINSIADEEGVGFIDINSKAKAELDLIAMLDDGVHPTEEGHKWVLKQVLEAITKL
jgi:lysophospholipase L1-like esterase